MNTRRGNTKNARTGKGSIDDPVLHRDIVFLTLRYLKGDLLLDALANIPYMAYSFKMDGFSEDTHYEELFESDRVF